MTNLKQSKEDLDAVLHWRGKHTQAIRERDALQQRLNEADQRVDELRGQIAKLNEEAEFCDKVGQGIEDGLRAKLDTAMGLLAEANGNGNVLWRGLNRRVNDFLSPTSTEGKDHE